ncbi:MAG TPA: Fe-Mn family superoxide dismutase [Candidatus Saccharimonadales bacterium]|nr:Fe-Mn family superoxide dismutase [Candidatus Saccharimonadales bacterium]
MLETKKFENIRGLNGISEKTMEEHYKLYEGYVKKYNEIEEKLKGVDLSAANQVSSEIRALIVERTFALGGVKNHESYFGILGGDGGEPSGKAKEIIDRDFGSFEKFKALLAAIGMSSRGWAFVVYDFDLNKLAIHPGDSQNTYGVWNAELIMALDVYEHAYFLDFGIKRADYIETFFKNIDWKKVDKSLEFVK